jgi:hypothetical protein
MKSMKMNAILHAGLERLIFTFEPSHMLLSH